MNYLYFPVPTVIFSIAILPLTCLFIVCEKEPFRWDFLHDIEPIARLFLHRFKKDETLGLTKDNIAR